MQQKRKDLCIVVNQSRASGRGLLQGILRFAESRPDWRMHLYEPNAYGFSETMRAIAEGTTDGVLTAELEDPAFADFLGRSKTPLVVVGSRKSCLPARKDNLGVVTFDEEKIGAFAAERLLSLGRFNSFGYVGGSSARLDFLSSLRCRGFLDELRRHGQRCSVLAPDDDIARWLAALERPAAVLGCVDDRAAEVVDACDRLGIAVPEQICVLGIDNSEAICTAVRPALSSVAVDCSEEGHAAAAELDRLMRRNTPRPRRTLLCLSRCSFVPRDSTCTQSPGLQLVSRARDYIDAHAEEPLTAEMVASHLHVSKRLLYLRFREFSDKTLHEAIVERRIEALKRKLATSRRSIGEITAACGFSNPTHVKTLFKRLTGTTLREWRKAATGANPGVPTAKT